MAGELGFEPRQTESESVVLPLHHSPRIAEQDQGLEAPVGQLRRGIWQNPGGSGGSTRWIRGLARVTAGRAFFERVAANLRHVEATSSRADCSGTGAMPC